MKVAPLTALALGLGTLIVGPVAAQENAPGPTKAPVAAQENAPGPTKAPDVEKAKDAEKAADKSSEAKPKARAAQTLLRVQVVVSRYQGDQKIGSAPYTFLVVTNAQRARVRMGVDVPIVVTKSGSHEPGIPPPTSYQYKNVGTNIDCSAEEDRGTGRYVLNLGVENSSVYTADGRSASNRAEFGQSGDRPLFRSFNVTLTPVLRDGETIQTVASTDPVSGEVVKIDVTLNVVK